MWSKKALYNAIKSRYRRNKIEFNSIGDNRFNLIPGEKVKVKILKSFDNLALVLIKGNYYIAQINKEIEEEKEIICQVEGRDFPVKLIFLEEVKKLKSRVSTEKIRGIELQKFEFEGVNIYKLTKEECEAFFIKSKDFSFCFFIGHKPAEFDEIKKALNIKEEQKFIRHGFIIDFKV